MSGHLPHKMLQYGQIFMSFKVTLWLYRVNSTTASDLTVTVSIRSVYPERIHSPISVVPLKNEEMNEYEYNEYFFCSSLTTAKTSAPLTSVMPMHWPVEVKWEHRLVDQSLFDHILEHRHHPVHCDGRETHSQDPIKLRSHKCYTWLLGGLSKCLPLYRDIPNLWQIQHKNKKVRRVETGFSSIVVLLCLHSAMNICFGKFIGCLLWEKKYFF